MKVMKNLKLSAFILTFVVTFLLSGPSFVHADSASIPTIDKQIEFLMSKGYINDDVVNELNRLSLQKSDLSLDSNEAKVIANTSNNTEINHISIEPNEFSNNNIYKTINLNKTQDIIFYKGGDFIVEELTEYPSIMKSAKLGVNYKTASNKKSIYKKLITGENQKFATVTVEGDFWYDGAKAGVDNPKGNYEAHVTFLNTKTFETKAESFDRGAGARAVTRGIFTTDLGIYQVGELPFDVRVSVTADGKVWKN